MTARVVVNFVTFQIAWLACVLGAANGVPLVYQRLEYLRLQG
jgi:hypothetical protein